MYTLLQLREHVHTHAHTSRKQWKSEQASPGMRPLNRMSSFNFAFSFLNPAIGSLLFYTT